MPAKPLFDEDLEAGLKDLLLVMKLTGKDIELASDIYEPSVDLANSGSEIDIWQLFMSAKPLIRALMGQLDAVGYMMRKVIVERAVSGIPSLTNKELATLSERKYDRGSDAVLEEPARFLPTTESFRLAARYFPSVFAEDRGVDFGEAGWNSVVRLAAARNRFTHPERMQDLIPRDAMVHLQPSLAWSQTVLRNLTGLAHEAAGGPDSSPLATHHIRPNRTKGLRDWEEILDEDFYMQVKSSGSRSLQYVTDMMKRLQNDTSYAWDLYSRRLNEIKPRDFINRPLDSDDGLQFAARNLLRAFFSQVEGTISFTRFMLEAASDRGEIKLTDEERDSFRSGNVDQQLLCTSSAWSREFGTGEVIERDSPGWRLFVQAIGWRNGVTHPQELFDFVLLPERIREILKLPSWFFGNPMRVLALVPEKFLK